MIMSVEVKTAFFSWVDSVLSQTIPKNTVAFNFNLYEGSDTVHIQIIGAETFDYGDDDWPCNETFTTGEEIFEIPFESVGAKWPELFESMKKLVTAYIESGNKADVLRNSQGVGIGFVDGDLYILWPNAEVLG